MGRYVPNDKWSKRAKEENYRARSVFKLRELDERFGLLRKGMHVLDCGAAPGSWLQYVAQRIGPQGKAIGVDLTPIEPVAENVITVAADLASEEAEAAIAPHAPFDLVLSDIAPSTSGIKDRDQWLSVALSELVLALALKHLKRGGHCAMKLLRGADFDPFLKKVKEHFGIVKTVTVKATREDSREVYIVALKKK